MAAADQPGESPGLRSKIRRALRRRRSRPDGVEDDRLMDMEDSEAEAEEAAIAVAAVAVAAVAAAQAAGAGAGAGAGDALGSTADATPVRAATLIPTASPSNSSMLSAVGSLTATSLAAPPHSPARPRASTDPDAAPAPGSSAASPFASKIDLALALPSRRPSTADSSIKATGFAVATAKRNREFHAMFRSVPPEDYLIEDYGCALQREILVHGRMYVSEGHICFNSNIFGWVTNLVIAFSEIVAIDKKSTAVIFPNAITITTLQQNRHIFASFISRDTTYDLIIKIWRISHPGSGYPRLVLNDSDLSDDESDDEDSDSLSDFKNAQSDVISDTSASKILTPRPTKSSQPPLTKSTSKDQSAAAQPVDSGTPSAIPSEHEPTECIDEHFEKSLIDYIIPASMDKVWNLMFGDNTSFMETFLLVNQKNTDLEISGFSGSKTRSYIFVKHLSASIGPKQTKCNTTDTIEQFSPQTISLVSVTQTPDVPNGSSFSIKTKYCFSWAEKNQTRLKSSYFVEWNKSSWLKGPIEKGVNEGQIAYSKDLLEALKKEFEAPSKRKRKVKSEDAFGDTLQTRAQKSLSEGTESRSWTDLFLNFPSSLLSTSGIIMLMLLFVVVFLIRIERSLSIIGKSGSFEENWKIQERELWNWLDSRGLEGSGKPVILLDESMKRREIAAAIKSLEKRLDELKRRQEL
ncbi:putative membrane protein [Neolecta irregularis DAH-3]|uniref:Putative membrane protein n=1 Tax=Neolecta irregularis (strain DAH-3) TaxID=1198029 RepID=A0A1U7LTF9_NEOID|nr:putative membrane protein [Neolecta irregularis DAH-3]|eukprot:OLL25898.1 putative membrane protein [Neolecta irregularis DAH-3]